MAKSTKAARPGENGGDKERGTHPGASLDELLLAAQERGDESFETGRFIITFKENALDEGIAMLKAHGMRLADARDFAHQALTLETVGDVDAVIFPAVGSALVGGKAFAAHGLSTQDEIAPDSPFAAIEPEYFMFANDLPGEYLRGFMRAVETITKDLARGGLEEGEIEPEVLGATWGLAKCKVTSSARSGVGMRVAVLDTGMDLGHPDFSGRLFVTNTFVGEPVQDMNSHGTHCIGTACGPKSPPGRTARYGIAFRSQIYAGKVLTNAGSGTTSSVLAGINWAIANHCAVISMSLGSQSPVQAAFTAAGQAALDNGCLIVAAAGNAASTTGAPANSPTIMSVAALDQTLVPSSFSNFGKIEIAAPGRDVFSSVPRPERYGIKSGTSMATPHVAGCAALWAETNAHLRGMALWNKLLSTAKALPFPAAKVGRGIVQAP
ncbi:MAG: S8 family serine peptidase [Pseudomonadota bacterium]